VNPALFIVPPLRDVIEVSLPLFRVELALAATIVLVLLVRMLPLLRRLDAGLVAMGGLLFVAWFAWDDLRRVPGSPWLVGEATPQSVELFTGLLVHDSLTAFIRLLLAGFLLLFGLFTKVSGIPDHEDSADFHVLVLGGTLGMCLMASANHLLMLFVAVEMASVPSYALAGLLKGRKASSEAALKYAVYGAGAAGIMLYGLSLLVGSLGTCHIPTAAARLSEIAAGGFADGQGMILALGGLMLAVGLAFKLSAVPFHFWAPDVFEGAAAEVGAFLSVASKTAAVALLIRVALGFGLPADLAPPAPPPATEAGLGGDAGTIMTVSAGERDGDPRSVLDGVGEERAAARESLAPVRQFSVGLIAVIAAATCTLGNLGAYGQTNIKRLLGYSTIAHAGYLMMGVAAAVALAGTSSPLARDAITAVAFYLGTYLFMNLGGFLIVAVLRNSLRSEEISSYAGLVQTSPGIVVAMAVVLVSLIGLPPLAGFVGKFLIFSSLVEGIAAGAERPVLMALLIVGGLNTVLSLFYYLRVLKVMTFDPPPSERPVTAVPLVSITGAVVTAFVVPILIFGVFWSGLHALARLAGGMVS
jgi:NADH-quinone oxidoreductase subunit N